MALFKVMQQTETGEIFCQFTGSESRCEAWIDNNADDYPESDFWVEGEGEGICVAPDYDRLDDDEC